MKIWKLLLLFGAIAAGTLSCGGDSPANEIVTNMVANGLDEPPAPEPMTVEQAQAAGAVDIGVRGVDLENIRFVLSSHRAVQLTLPAGLVLISGDAGTQNMMTGRASVVVLNGTPEAPDVQEIVVPAYCINRFRATPTTASTFSVGSGGGELQPLARLAQCIEGHSAAHRSKQLTIWAVSDDFVNMDAEQFAARAVDHLRSEVIRLGPDGYADKVEREGAPAAFVAQLRALSPSQLVELFDRQASGIAEAARVEFEEIRAAARPLLEACGYNVASLRMFATTGPDPGSNAT